jgi:predicted transcriptional regulator
MARKIIEKHHLNEKQTAELLGLTQSAVSRYKTKNRGNIIEIEHIVEVQVLIEQMTDCLIKEPENRHQIMTLFCQTCTIIRQKTIICGRCQKDPKKICDKPCDFCGHP